MHEEKTPTLKAQVLAQLLIMQNVLCNLPNEKSIFSFVCRGLTDIPGVAGANYSVIPKEIPDASLVRLPLHAGHSNLGEILIKVADPLAFAPYESYLKNFCYMVAVILEERYQRRLNEEHKTQLEQRVQERTKQLNEEIAERRLVEEELRRGRNMVAHILNSVPQSIFWKDRNSVYLGCNEVFARAVGLPNPGQIVGKTDFDLSWPRNEAEAYRADDEEVITKKLAKRHIIEPVQEVDGTRVWADTTKVPLVDENNDVYGVLGVYEDITGRKRAEDALRESEERFRRIVDAANEGICAVDGEFRITFVNQRMADMLGYTVDEILGRTADSFMYEEDLDDHGQKMEARRTGGESIYDRRMLRKDGETIWTIVSATPISGPDGAFVGSFAMVTDITDRKRAEEALRESQEQLRTIFDTSPAAIFLVNPEGRITFANRRMGDLFSRRYEELFGTPYVDLVHPAQRSIGYEKMKSLMAGEIDQVTVERRYVANDGREFIGHLSGRRLLRPDGGLEGLVGIITDMTDRKKVEEALRASEDLFRSVLQTAADAIISIDSQGNVILWNDAAEKIFGYSSSEAIGKPLTIIMPERFREAHMAGLERAVRTDKWGHHLTAVEVMGLRKDGKEFPAELSVAVVKLSGRTLFTGIVRDITEQKKVAEAVRRSEEQYRSLFEGSIDGVYSVLRDGTISDANASFCALFGYVREEMIGKDIRELYLDPADRPKFQEAIEKNGFVKDYEIKFRKRDGTEIDCLITSSVHFGEDGSIVGYRGIVRDLTLRKGLRRQLLQAQKMEAVGTLAGGVAHDFNNLLQIVLGYSELILCDEDLPDNHRKDLAKVNQAARNGADLVQGLLTFSRKTEIKPLPLSLNRRIEQLQKMLSRTIPKMIMMELLLASNLSPINADPTQVDQVLMNLAVNARDAMPEGGKLVIETENVIIDEDYGRVHLGAEPGLYVLLSVSDTGQGMDKETLQHIFEPFYTTKGPGAGTGLGLAMVYGIVKQHGGHIMCYSEPGAGTTFKIYFPAIISDEESREVRAKRSARGGSETVLLVDDEEMIRDLGSRVLTKAGYKVVTASNGKDALNVYEARSAEIALVVLDLIMPEMGGKQCLEGLLKLNPAVKVVIASGYSADGPTKDALAAGAKGFVNKPYDIRQVMEVVRSVLDEREKRT